MSETRSSLIEEAERFCAMHRYYAERGDEPFSTSVNLMRGLLDLLAAQPQEEEAEAGTCNPHVCDECGARFCDYEEWHEHKLNHGARGAIPTAPEARATASSATDHHSPGKAGGHSEGKA